MTKIEKDVLKKLTMTGLSERAFATMVVCEEAKKLTCPKCGQTGKLSAAMKIYNGFMMLHRFGYSSQDLKTATFL